MDEARRMTFISIEPAVVPYSFEVWHAKDSGRRGGAANFRGECRPGGAGATDARLLRWWHPAMSFVPSRSDLPSSFRVLVVVHPDKAEKALRLWGDCVRDNPADANDEMDNYLESLGKSGGPGQTRAD